MTPSSGLSVMRALEAVSTRARGLPPAMVRGALLVYWIVLLVLIHMPIPRTTEPNNGSDKIVHFVLYGWLAFLLTASLDRLAAGGWKLRVGLVLALVSAQGLIDELTQPLTGRDCDPWDWLADSVGALAALGAFYACRCWLTQARRS